MSSDIELGDDESITLKCAQLVARSTTAETAPVILRGSVQAQDRIYLAEPPPKPRLDPESSTGVPIKAPPGAVIGSLRQPARESPGELSRPRYSDVYSKLRNRPVPVDLWEELELLRAAVLELAGKVF
jgi:hypothetical protein